MQGEISAGGLIIGGIIGQRGAPGNGIVSITLTGSSGLEDTYTILYTNGDTETFIVTNGAEGNGIASITKTSSVGLVDTYTILYTNGSSDTIEVHNGEKGDKGDKGDTGATPNLTIGSVTKGADASATITGTTDNPVLNLVLPKGDKGDKGDTGNTGATGVGIYSITKTGTADLVDTYTILYTNGDTQTYTITNGAKGDTGATGNGIASITKTGTAGLVDTYTITYTNGDTDTFDVTNGADGNVTDVQVEGVSVVDNGVANITGLATQEELNRYKTIYNVLPKVTDSDVETSTLNNTGEATLKIDLKGNTSQYTTTGKNKLETSLAIIKDKNITGTWNNNVYSVNNLTFTINDDLSIKVNGTANANTNFRIEKTNNTLDSGSYILSGCPSNGDYDKYLVQVWNSDWTDLVNDIGASSSFTLTTQKSDLKIALRILSGTQINNLTFYPMIRLSTSSSDYEPYTNGASPNPDYPQPVNVVSGDNTITICGDNLLNIQALVKGRIDSGVLGYAYATSNLTLNDNSFSFTTTEGYRGVATDYMLVEELTDYVLSYISTDTLQRLCDCYDSNKNWLGRVWFEDISINNQKITTLANTRYVRVSWQLNATGTGTITNPIFKKSSVAIEYIRYKGQTYPITLPTGTFMGAIGTYKDGIFHAINGDTYYDSLDSATKLTLTYGKWYLHKEIEKVVLDGSEEGWATRGTSGTDYRHQISKANLDITSLADYDIFSNYFTKRAGTVGNWGEANMGGTYLTFFDKNALYDNNQFKTWLSTHNTILYYVYATATDIEITDTTLITQLDNILNAISYEGQTNVSQENNDKPFILDLVALRSMLDYGDE